MGLLDDLKNAAMGNTAGSSPATAILEMVQNHPGGFQGLVQAFQSKGMGGLVGSWMSNGTNQLVSASQIESVLGSDRVREFAAKAGISPDQASGKLAELLPTVMDKLTPNGQAPQGNLLETGMSLLKSLGQ